MTTPEQQRVLQKVVESGHPTLIAQQRGTNASSIIRIYTPIYKQAINQQTLSNLKGFVILAIDLKQVVVYLLPLKRYVLDF